MKAYTDLNQSKKLAEILPLESADMHYVLIDTDEDKYDAGLGKYIGILPHYPCWSLAALLRELPKSLIYTPNQALDGYCCKNIMHDLETYGDNPIDACYEMIIKLHEQKLL